LHIFNDFENIKMKLNLINKQFVNMRNENN
jgi:hypothetical protein